MARKRTREPKKTTLGLREKVAIRAVGGKKWRIFTAKLDTGAVWSRIGARKAAQLGLGPILDVVRIKTSGGGRQSRVLVPASLRIGSHRIAARFSVSMRRPSVDRNTDDEQPVRSRSQEALSGRAAIIAVIGSLLLLSPSFRAAATAA